MTRQHSIVQHKANYFYLMLEDDYITLYEHIAQQVNPQKEQDGKKLSGPSDCKAMIASVLEHWMNSKRATAKCEEDLYVYMTYEEWEQALRYRYKRSTIIQCLKEMECEGAWKDEEGKYGEPGMEYIGTVKKRHFVQNTYQYVLHLPVVQGMLTQLPEQSPFEQKPRPSLGRPSKNRSNKNDIKINGLILDDGSVKTNDGSVKTNAPFYTQITTQTDHTSESMYDTYASVMPASAEHDAHTPSQSENENHSHQEQVTPTTSYSQQSDQTDNKKEEGQNGHNAIRLHGGATPSGSDVLPTPVELPTPVNQQTAQSSLAATHGDSATVEQPQQQEVTPQVELPAQPQEQASESDVAAIRKGEQATLLDVPLQVPSKKTTKPKTEKPAKPPRQKAVSPDELEPEEMEVFTAWCSLFKVPISLSDAMKKASKQLAPSLKVMREQDVTQTYATILKDIQGWLYVNDKTGYYKRGVKLYDVAREIEGYLAAKEREERKAALKVVSSQQPTTIPTAIPGYQDLSKRNAELRAKYAK